MFLSVDFFVEQISGTPNIAGVTLLDTPSFASTNYTDVYLTGNAIYDDVHSMSNKLTISDINTIFSSITGQVRTDDTYFLANFDNQNLQAGNFTEINEIIKSYIVKRRKLGETYFKTLGETDIPTLSTPISFFDYTMPNLDEYEYGLVAKTVSSQLSNINTATPVNHDFYIWFLTDINNTSTYKFDLDLNTSDISILDSVEIKDNFTKYAYVNMVKKKYKRGNISTIPYALNNEDFLITNEILEDFRTFITDDNIKIMRNPSGEVIYVKTYNLKYKYNDIINEQSFVIAFDFVEVDYE